MEPTGTNAVHHAGIVLVTGIRKHHSFFTVQQAMTLRGIVDIGSCADDGVYQARVSIDTNVRLHAEVP